MATPEESEARKRQLQQIDSFRRGTTDSTPERPPASRYIDWFHSQASFRRPTDLHHQIGTNAWDAAAGNHTHDITEFADFETSVHTTPSGGAATSMPTWTGDAEDVFSGSYTRVGNLVHFSYQVDFDNITSFGSGQYYMELPYAAEHEYVFRNGCLHDDSTGDQYHITGHVDAGSTTMQLFWSDKVSSAVQDVAFEQGTPLTLDVADNFHISGMYERQPD